MRYYDEIYSEVVPFKFIKYIALSEGLTGVAFVVLFFLHINGTLDIEDELPYFFFPLMAAVMLGVAVFLYSLVRLKLGITTEVIRASFGFIKFEVSLGNVVKVSTDDGSSLKYGGWGVRLAKGRAGWVLAYTSIGFKRVILELKEHKYNYFVFSAAHPDEVVDIINQQIERRSSEHWG